MAPELVSELVSELIPELITDARTRVTVDYVNGSSILGSALMVCVEAPEKSDDGLGYSWSVSMRHKNSQEKTKPAGSEFDELSNPGCIRDTNSDSEFGSPRHSKFRFTASKPLLSLSTSHVAQPGEIFTSTFTV